MSDVNDPQFSPFRMIAGNLTARPLRALLSVLAISIQVILVLMIVGLTTGVVNEWSKRVEGVGADILVQSPNASIFFAFSSAVMQESFGDQIASLPGVDEVAPTLSLMDQKNFVVIYGIDYKRFNALSKGFLFGSGGPFTGPDDAIADDIVAQSRHLKVGDQISLLGHSFTICGIVAHGKGARFFIPLKTAQDISGAERRVSVFYVRSKGDTEGTRAEILNLEPSNRVRSISEYMTLMNSSNLPELKPFIKTMVGIGIVISFLVVFLNMHTLVLERTREIGILKALGFTRAGIAKLLLGETLALTIIGSLVGIGLTFLTEAILKQTVPTLQVQITGQWLIGSVLLAIAGATAGAIYPTLRAASYDPVVALAYE
ncbi:MAG TPA: FtsX-like permease family protein [Candidatus Acidoferrum sp.]|nr:FtsX-like permease family protein [Candidatus Acidoferrum sp.]